MSKKNLCSLADHVVGDFTVEDLFANIPGHIYAKDRNGVYIACNNFNVTQGLPSKSFLGKTDADMPWKEKAETIHKHDKEVMELGRPKIYIEQGKLQDGKQATAISYKAPLRDEDNNVIGIIGNTLQFTEELAEELDKLVQSNRHNKKNKA
jgi:two-component system, OmpR family, aerobic respiration control sensor histidine kinase ArcB